MKKKIPLYLQILIGLALGTGWGVLAVYAGWIKFTTDWIKPFGVIFMNLLKLIAIPLIFVSLIKGVTSLKDISRLSKIGLKTIFFYILSTVIAITIGLLLVNTIRPGKAFSSETRDTLVQQYQDEIDEKQSDARERKERGPLQFLVDIVPDNIVSAASNNSMMLQVIFFAILFGIAVMMVPGEKTQVLRSFFDGANDVILKMIDIIMLFAPVGVFALIGGLIVEVAGNDPGKTMELFGALGLYGITVVAGLVLMVVVIYPLLIRYITGSRYMKFLRGIFPAQMLAFTTSSSAATLPVTMECCEENLKLDKEITSFVLPVGATINMDGTSLYQAVAAVFIAQAFGMDLSLTQQLIIVLTATLASIGSAAVPGAGIVMLVIVLESIHVPVAGIGLILAVDRPLDMLRTTVNVTGDATVSSIIHAIENRKKRAEKTAG